MRHTLAVALLVLSACGEANQADGGDAPTPDGGDVKQRRDAGQSRDDDAAIDLELDARIDATDDDAGEAVSWQEQVNAWILDGTLPSVLERARNEEPPVVARSGTDCKSTTSVSSTGSTASYVVFNPNDGVLYPGSLVQAGTAHTGVLDPVSAPRAPMDVVLTGAALTQSGDPLPTSVFTMSPASFTRYEQVRRDLVGDGFIPQGAWDYSEVTYYSFEQALMDLNISAEWISGEAAGKLNLANSTARTKILMEFKQRYYTTSVDAPSMPSDVFADGVGLDALMNQSDPNSNPIAYVANVVYGRHVLVSVESEATEESLRAALSASQSFLAGSAQLSASTEQQSIVNSARVQVYSVGDDPREALKVIAEADKVSAMRELIGHRNPSDTLVRFGVPISYTLRYLRNNQLARCALASEFNITRVLSPFPRIDKLAIVYYVHDDDKDYNTQMTARILKGGTEIARREDNGYVWPDHTVQGLEGGKTFNVSSFELDAFAGSSLQVCERATGNDGFNFHVAIVGTTTNGQSYTWSSPQVNFQNGSCATWGLAAPAGPYECTAE